MKNIVKSGLFAFALAAFAVQPSFEKEAPAAGRAPDPVSYGYTVLRVGIGTPVALPWGFDWDIFGLDVNFLYSDANKMDGIQIGGLANVARLNMNGFQAALCCNLANRDANGLTVSAVNLCNGEFMGINIDAVGVNRGACGLTIDGLGAGVDRSFYGLSIAGLTSMVREDMWGWQIAGGATFARRVHGFQTSLLFNMTDDLRGAQLGLINYAATCTAGFQIGLLNIITDNQVPFLPIFNCCF